MRRRLQVLSVFVAWSGAFAQVPYQRIVGADISKSVDNTLAIRRRRDSGRSELRLLPPGRVEPVGIEEMQPVALAHLGVQEFENPLPAFLRIRVHDTHYVLCGIAIT